jgi:predicted nucleic acid-binding protein
MSGPSGTPVEPGLRQAVLDASVVLKWYGRRTEPHEAEALAVREAYEAGDLSVLAPPLLALELVNVAGRRWGWNQELLEDLADGLEALGFEWREPGLDRVARWTACGLSAYDAAYVALSEEVAVRLITDDRRIIALAGPIALPLEEWPRDRGR